MNLSDLIGALLLLLLAYVGLAALALLYAALFPGLVARARQHVEHTPRRAMAVGLVNALFFILVGLALSTLGDLGRLLALLWLTTLLAFITLGLSAVAGLLGARLGLGGADPLRRTLAGMLALELAALTPLVGWIAVPLLVGLTGYGAVIIAMLQRRRPSALPPGEDTRAGSPHPPTPSP